MRHSRLFCLAVLTMSAFGERDTTLRLDDGSELLIPNGFFYRLEFLEHETTRTVLRGDCRNLSASFFLFLSQRIKGRSGYDPFTALSRVTDLTCEEVIPAGFEFPAIKGRFRQGRVTKAGNAEGFGVLAVSEVMGPEVFSFFLIGPEEELPLAIPGFIATVSQFKPGEIKSAKKGNGIKRNQPSSWMVIAAIGVLVANLFAILFGFKEIARRGNEEERI